MVIMRLCDLPDKEQYSQPAVKHFVRNVILHLQKVLPEKDFYNVVLRVLE